MSKIVRLNTDVGLINELYVFISNDGKGNDGIVTSGPDHLPLMTSKLHVANLLIEQAREIAQTNGINIRLLRFSATDEIAFIAGKH